MVVVEKVKEPVADWLPIVLLFVLTSPLLTRIAENGELVDPVPLDVTPVKLTEAIVLVLMFEMVPRLIPLNAIP